MEEKNMLPREYQERLVLFLFEQNNHISRSRTAASRVNCVILKGSWCRKAILIKVLSLCKRH